ncbi:MAG: YqgE/AlgH family protein [Alphaproteobacteria bacterium]
MSKTIHQGEYLAGQCLVAMPLMTDPRFSRTVIYLCAHTPEGAMGLVINRAIDALTFPDLLEQLGIESGPHCSRIQVHFGGPVEAGRGFVLHSSDYVQDATMIVDRQMALTATVDVLKDIAQGQGPRRSILALGYAGWSPGQLDTELRENVWLTVPADEDLVFSDDLDHKWEQAMARLGITISMLSGEAGHA